MRFVTVGVIVAVMAVGACRSGGHEDGEPATACTRYAVFQGEDWSLRESIDYPADRTSLPDPTIDWYSEFEKTAPNPDGSVEGLSLVISGHDVGVDELRSGSLRGIELHAQPRSADTLVSADPGGATVVVTPVDESYTRVFTSYGLSTDELLKVAAEARTACREQWIAAGGEVIDCTPPEPDCAP